MYVPVMPPPPPTREAQDLSHRVAEAVDEFLRDHPHMTVAEIRQALDLAKAETGVSVNERAITGLVLGLLAFAGLALFAFLRLGGGAGDGAPIPWMMVAVVVMILVVGVLAIVRSR